MPGFRSLLARIFRLRRARNSPKMQELLAQQRVELEHLRRGHVRWPKAGEVYELQHDATLDYLTHWRAPFTGGGKAEVKAGTRIVVEVFPEALAGGATAGASPIILLPGKGKI